MTNFMWTISIILICIGLNAILAGIEIAFIAVNKSVLRSRASQGVRQAKELLKFKENPEKTLSTIQIGITLLAALSAAVGGAAAGLNIVPFLQDTAGLEQGAAELISLMFVVFPITYLSVVIGEITPKALAIRNPLYFAMLGLPVLRSLNIVLYPLARLCELSTKALLRQFPKRNKQKEDDEYEKVLSGYYKLPQKGKEYMINLGKIEDIGLNRMLVKWRDVDYITVNQKLESVETKILSSGHTRMPVVDNERVVGVINTKEILAFAKNSDTSDWKNLVHKPIIFSLTASPLDSLNVLQKSHGHMAIIEDSDHKPVGIVTIEDIIEEVLGEIYDEDDEGSLRKILQKKKK